MFEKVTASFLPRNGYQPRMLYSSDALLLANKLLLMLGLQCRDPEPQTLTLSASEYHDKSYRQAFDTGVALDAFQNLQLASSTETLDQKRQRKDLRHHICA